jgi:rhamnosyltransferase subunit B
LQSHIRENNTVLVGSTLAWSVRFAQERLGVPAATMHLSPSCILSADAPPRLPGLARWFAHLPRSWRRAFIDWMERRFLDGVVCDDLNAMRAQIGLPPVTRVFSQWQHSPQRVICAWPEWFCAPQADWPKNNVTTGFPLWRATASRPRDDAEQESRHVSGLSAKLEHFLTAGEAPIGFTPGSAMAFGKPFFERALRACERLGKRAVFVTPFAEQLPWSVGDTSPAFIHHEPYVPFDLLLPRLAAFVHHGGIGTTAQTMAAGIPQLITPFAHDQFDNATRVAHLGCGAELAPDAAPRKWASALSYLLDSTEVKAACERVEALMANESEVLAQIVTHIEALTIQRERIAA